MADIKRLDHLETERLLIRNFVIEDLITLHQILDIKLEWGKGLEKRKRILEDTITETLHGDQILAPRAVVLKESNTLIGNCGYETYFLSPEQYGLFSTRPSGKEGRFNTRGFGMHYAFDPSYHGQGYATEAVRALVDFAFQSVNVHRIWITTSHDNERSQKLMKRIGMKIGKDPDLDIWPGVIGYLENKEI